MELKTLRDEFAMAALAGLLACPVSEGRPEEFAKWSYQYADLMLEARQEKEVR